MSDDKTQRGSQDRQRINVHEDYEVRYWSEKFGVTRQQLEDAVRAVGPMAEQVGAHLKKH